MTRTLGRATKHLQIPPIPKNELKLPVCPVVLIRPIVDGEEFHLPAEGEKILNSVKHSRNYFEMRNAFYELWNYYT